MLLTLDLEGEKPLYQQIRDQIVEGLATGLLKDGESLPATRQLAMNFGINFHTVNKAYDILRREGLLRLNRKTGAVVTLTAARDEQMQDWTGRLRTLLAEAYVKGMSKEQILQHCNEVTSTFDALLGHSSE